VGAFLAQDQPGTRRPGRQVREVGDLDDPGPVAGLAVGVVGRRPRVVRDLTQDGVDVDVVQRGTHGELHPQLSDLFRERVGGPGGVGAHQHLHRSVLVGFPQVFGDLRQRLIEHVDVVLSGVAARAAPPQQSGHRFPGAAITMVDEPQQRVVAKGLYPGLGRVFLLASAR
jgi:hypothetical protein